MHNYTYICLESVRGLCMTWDQLEVIFQQLSGRGTSKHFFCGSQHQSRMRHTNWLINWVCSRCSSSVNKSWRRRFVRDLQSKWLLINSAVFPGPFERTVWRRTTGLTPDLCSGCTFSVGFRPPGFGLDLVLIWPHWQCKRQRVNVWGRQRGRKRKAHSSMRHQERKFDFPSASEKISSFSKTAWSRDDGWVSNSVARVEQKNYNSAWSIVTERSAADLADGRKFGRSTCFDHLHSEVGAPRKDSG